MMALLQRLGWSVVILLGVTLLTFVIAFIVPSDAARTVAGPKADPQTLQTIRQELGLDLPWPVQYARYIERLVHGDFGRSYLTRQDVLQAILERLPATAYLAVTSLVIAALIGVGLGCCSAVWRGSALDLSMLVGSL